MKKIATVLLLLFIISLNTHSTGQINIVVVNAPVAMSKGEQPAYIVEIPEANYELTLKNWKKLIRENTKNKVEEMGSEVVIEGTQIPAVHSEPISIYSVIIKSDSALKLIALFEIDSVFFEYSESTLDVENEKTHSQIEHFMRNFAVEQYMLAVEDEFGQESNTLKKLNKELADLAKENENLLKDIKGNEQDIQNAEDAIGSLQIDNDRKQTEIDNKKQAISGISDDPDLRKQAENQLKSLEKGKKGIQDKLEKEQKNIVKYNANIESLNLEVERNIEKQNSKKDEINKQELVVESVREKLHNIK